MKRAIYPVLFVCAVMFSACGQDPVGIVRDAKLLGAQGVTFQDRVKANPYLGTPVWEKTQGDAVVMAAPISLDKMLQDSGQDPDARAQLQSRLIERVAGVDYLIKSEVDLQKKVFKVVFHGFRIRFKDPGKGVATVWDDEGDFQQTLLEAKPPVLFGNQDFRASLGG
jgi:hypothetical protein